MTDKTYIGDGVYAETRPEGLVLTTSDGHSVTNRIVLDAATWETLKKWVRSGRRRAWAEITQTCPVFVGDAPDARSPPQVTHFLINLRCGRCGEATGHDKISDRRARCVRCGLEREYDLEDEENGT